MKEDQLENPHDKMFLKRYANFSAKNNWG